MKNISLQWNILVKNLADFLCSATDFLNPSFSDLIIYWIYINTTHSTVEVEDISLIWVLMKYYVSIRTWRMVDQMRLIMRLYHFYVVLLTVISIFLLRMHLLSSPYKPSLWILKRLFDPLYGHFSPDKLEFRKDRKMNQL